MIAVFALVISTVIVLIDPWIKQESPSAFEAILVFIGALLYLVIDLAGLSLLKRIQQYREISWQIMNRLSVALLLQFIVQLVLAFELISTFKTLYAIRQFWSYLPKGFLAQLISMVISDLVIFCTASFNIYSTLKLLQMARKRQDEKIRNRRQY